MAEYARPRLHGIAAAFVHVSLLAACAPHPAAATPARSALSCEYGQWSAPRLVGADSSVAGVVARFPSLASTRGGRKYIAGTDIRSFGTDAMRANALGVWQLGDTSIGTSRDASIGRPPGSLSFGYPRLFVDEEDRLHLVWGEPNADAARLTTGEWSNLKPSTLWSATYTPQRGWSTPRQIFDGREVQWIHAAAATRPVAAHVGVEQDRWLLSVTDEARIGGQKGPRRIVLLRIDGGEIKATAFPTPHLRPVLTSLAAAGEELYLGMISPVPDTLPRPHGASDANSVLLLVSHDGGREWDPVRVVSRSGRNPAFRLRSFLSSDGALHLVWRQTFAGGGEVFRHVRSVDGGRSWSAPDDLPSPGMTNEFQAVMDECGTLHLVYEHLDLENELGHDVGHLDYATLGSEGWSRVEHLFPTTWDATDATLQRAPDGRLLLGFVAKPFGAPIGAPWAAMYSELSPRQE